MNRLSWRALLTLALFTALPWPASLRAEPNWSESWHRLPFQAEERRFLLHRPSTPVPVGHRYPTVLVLHGGGGNAEHAARMTGFSAVAVPDGALVVYPEGSGRLARALKTWNAGHCCGYAMEQRVDDVGFLRALLDHLVQYESADPRRLYVTGLSNGGMMTHRVGIALADRLAAIAPVIAGLFGDESMPVASLPVFMINGAQDDSVPFEGGQTGGRFAGAWDGTPLQSFEKTGDFWGQANHCAAGKRPWKTLPSGATEALYRERRLDCVVTAPVVQWLVTDVGHAWPGGERGRLRADAPGKAVEASRAIWTFFQQHQRPPP